MAIVRSEESGEISLRSSTVCTGLEATLMLQPGGPSGLAAEFGSHNAARDGARL